MGVGKIILNNYYKIEKLHQLRRRGNHISMLKLMTALIQLIFKQGNELELRCQPTYNF